MCIGSPTMHSDCLDQPGPHTKALYVLLYMAFVKNAYINYNVISN